MKPAYRKQPKATKPAAPKAQSTMEDAVVPQLMDQIMSLRAENKRLKSEIEQLKLTTVRTDAKRVTYRNGVEQ